MTLIGTGTKREFWMRGTNGRRYFVIERVRLHDVRTHENLNAAPLEGLRSLRISDGKAVDSHGCGRYEIVATCDVLTEE